jgi:AAHS family 4-hydroxybenzoate transporter-like MFS transporter
MAGQSRRIDVAEFISARGLGGYQIMVVTLCLAVVVFDGYDTQAIGYVAPYMLRELHLTRGDLGPIFSAALIGSGVGALLTGPIADRIGRKPLIICAVLIFGLFTFLTAQSSSVRELLAYRFLAGLGLGAGLANAAAMVVEYTPRNRQVTAVLWLFLGFSLGSMIGGFLSSSIIAAFTWRSIFYIGAVVPLLLAPMLWMWLPESIRFLTVRRADQIAVAKLIGRIDPTYVLPADTVFVSNEPHGEEFPVKQLFQDRRAIGTLLLWTISFMSLLDIFFLQNWLPTIAADAGLKIGSAVLATTFIQVGSIVCTFFIPWPMGKWGPAPVLAVLYFIGWLAISAIGYTLLDATLLTPVCFVVGCCIATGQNGINAVSATFYPTVMRVTGTGWTQGIGRIGSILSPFIGSAMIAAKFPHAPMFIVIAVASLIASIAFVIFAVKYPATPAKRLPSSAELATPMPARNA